MFFTALSGYLKPSSRIKGWRDNKTRSLSEAAHLAHAFATDEHLPIEGPSSTHPDAWYAESILKIVPVYGTRSGRVAQVEIAGLRLDDQAQTLATDTGEPVWRDLHVTRKDFGRYLEWLRSVW